MFYMVGVLQKSFGLNYTTMDLGCHVGVQKDYKVGVVTLYQENAFYYSFLMELFFLYFFLSFFLFVINNVMFV